MWGAESTSGLGHILKTKTPADIFGGGATRTTFNLSALGNKPFWRGARKKVKRNISVCENTQRSNKRANTSLLQGGVAGGRVVSELQCDW